MDFNDWNPSGTILEDMTGVLQGFVGEMQRIRDQMTKQMSQIQVSAVPNYIRMRMLGMFPLLGNPEYANVLVLPSSNLQSYPFLDGWFPHLTCFLKY